MYSVPPRRHIYFCTEGGIRTHDPFRAEVFKTSVYATPPLRYIFVVKERFELSIPKASVFETDVYSVPPLDHLAEVTGFEPAQGFILRLLSRELRYHSAHTSIGTLGRNRTPMCPVTLSTVS